MSRDLNQCTFIGRLGSDPEVRYSQSGTAFASFNIAVGDDYTDKQTNQKQERTEWVPIVMSGRQAEVAGEYLSKGSMVCITGKFKTREWVDQNTGQKRYKSEIHATSMQMLSGGQQQNQGQQGGYGHPTSGSGYPPQQRPAPQPNNQPKGAHQRPTQQYSNSSPNRSQPAPAPDFDDD